MPTMVYSLGHALPAALRVCAAGRTSPPATGDDPDIRALFNKRRAISARRAERHAFQEDDVVGISRACTVERHNARRKAFEIATSGRPGPVLVDLPKDATAGVLRRVIPT
ncbi:hypothetical protein FSARC_7397 [Fusarium sarcochroum]|uniref:Uncharacterized protein n=1 Tax=Fusarium sarcochroum TaxID=1208366 RepID=A0A8H4TVE4_9HYPO|nr:hypothetical protein FSARC_7397 [Fusarium sarcochroum]